LGDFQGHRDHKSVVKCGVKISLGECVKVNDGTKREVADRIQRIGHNNEGYSNLQMLKEQFQDHLRIKDCLPSGTRRVQIKAFYHDSRGEDRDRYVFCVLLNSRGAPLSLKKGTETVTYENVFVSITAMIQHIPQCDYVFFQKMQVETKGKGKKRKCNEQVKPKHQKRKKANQGKEESSDEDDILLSELDTRSAGRPRRENAHRGLKKIMNALDNNGMD
jgi:hypothetical protein